MKRSLLKLTLRSLYHYRKTFFYQFLIIILLCAVISGSLMTGNSVRASLKNTALQNIGNTHIYISSGVRYFDKKLVRKFADRTGLQSNGLLELRGSCQALMSQKTVNNIYVYAVDDNFFRFHGQDTITINSGEIIVNRKLATALGISEGDEVIIRFKEITDIPTDAPFAPAAETGTSLVLKTGKISGSDEIGNFSLAISQVPQANIFLNISDLEKLHNKKYKINRLLVAKNTVDLSSALKDAIEPSDIGLQIRKVKQTGETEIISDRVFFDDELVEAVRKKIETASPVITYLANSIEKSGKINPYSFISALPSGLYPEIPSAGKVIINRWLSEDIDAKQGDTLKIAWYTPDSLNQLVERSDFFIVEAVKNQAGIWADSMLMPEFPGIARSASCSAWDAGIPVKTNLIRKKDEDFWNVYKGTPKAFLSYDTGKEIWGSNYGPATAIRFPADHSAGEVNKLLSGTLDPAILGFTINDIYSESLRAAGNSVDFGTLFLSLGIFLILASFILLSFAISFYFDQKKREIKIFHSLGFRNSTIRNLLISEFSFIILAACFAGSLAGYPVNSIIISALNTVWTGAVQTNALSSVFDIKSAFTGFIITSASCIIFAVVKSNNYLKRLSAGSEKHHSFPDNRKNFSLLMAGTVVTVFLIALSLATDKIVLSFISGVLLLFTLILLLRQFLLTGRRRNSGLSGLYYSFYPSYAITPVLFISAGLFAVLITAVNRTDFKNSELDRSSGTGGYDLWMETSMPVTYDLNSLTGRHEFGFEDSLSVMSFVQMKRSEGNDASCLNLNHITAPPLLGVDPEIFIRDGAFSFTKNINISSSENQWDLLEYNISPYVIYGIADQTVLDWGLKTNIGDTLVLRAENGHSLKIIIAAGMQSSVFQGYVLISGENFSRYYPSVSGNSVFLAEGAAGNSEFYRKILEERLAAFGVTIEKTSERLEKFYEITNTYLGVFGVFGGLGMIAGIAGLGFVMLRNYNRRKPEFALMLATGFTPSAIKRMIFSEQVLILLSGIICGLIPAVVATLPSLRSGQGLPWLFPAIIVLAILITGILAVKFSLRTGIENTLMSELRKE